MALKAEKTIEVSSWIVMAFLLIRYVPKNKIREASVAFLFKQLITWLFGLAVVETGLIKYPSRLFFKHATKSSFTFEYFVYPGLCVLFNLYYPEKRNLLVKALYYTFHAGIITFFELIAVNFTQLIRYPKWTWYWSFLTMWSSNYLSRLFFRWFYKIN
ncbi:CBO0543 family protein [Sutcliffiella halmapala]|uniref:CBO0543 family protein n=1 Tax=Sutcliffiella halmapala TaxID=79882 RepID=UPI000994CD43|nr:CBO0543 family protein [Sutcliffiella halmapala]